MLIDPRGRGEKNKVNLVKKFSSPHLIENFHRIDNNLQPARDATSSIAQRELYQYELSSSKTMHPLKPLRPRISDTYPKLRHRRIPFP